VLALRVQPDYLHVLASRLLLFVGRFRRAFLNHVDVAEAECRE